MLKCAQQLRTAEVFANRIPLLNIEFDKNVIERIFSPEISLLSDNLFAQFTPIYSRWTQNSSFQGTRLQITWMLSKVEMLQRDFFVGYIIYMQILLDNSFKPRWNQHPTRRDESVKKPQMTCQSQLNGGSEYLFRINRAKVLFVMVVVSLGLGLASRNRISRDWVT